MCTTLNTHTLHTEQQKHTLETVNIYCRTISAHRTQCTPSEHHVQHTKHTYCILCCTLNIHCRANCTQFALHSAHDVQHTEHKHNIARCTVHSMRLHYTCYPLKSENCRDLTHLTFQNYHPHTRYWSGQYTLCT